MRCLVLSDIHSNLEAFQAVLDDAGPVDEVWCLGDVVGYGPDPNACVDLLRSMPHLCIAGNHDWATLGKLDLRDFNPDAREANLWNRQQLTPENLAYLDALPETLVGRGSSPWSMEVPDTPSGSISSILPRLRSTLSILIPPSVLSATPIRR